MSRQLSNVHSGTPACQLYRAKKQPFTSANDCLSFSYAAAKIFLIIVFE